MQVLEVMVLPRQLVGRAALLPLMGSWPGSEVMEERLRRRLAELVVLVALVVESMPRLRPLEEVEELAEIKRSPMVRPMRQPVALVVRRTSE